ncbi:hypothetical protein GDO86_014630 [Hymenochirus boettgeri]|uniref:Regulator of telomere elongation helicase 1 n=1 Tax=Hymenochirus boettgeri TaxID=247094 RepID=A0A8T2JPL1_9PIPI|nr:hypothetical protein GDO86_014630 [Hymenochirus boettgeri]
MNGAELFLDRPTASWGNATVDGQVSDLFCFRTHSQLTQVISELKQTSYRPRVCVLGSREQCDTTEVKKQESTQIKVLMCRSKVSTRSCHFYNNVDEKRTQMDLTHHILDIEDLVKSGTKHSTCPYYLSRNMKQHAEIIFMPYNYLLDPKSRRAHNIDLKGTVVIFDEAHNVEQICEESTSFDLTTYDLASGIDAIDLMLKEQMETMEHRGFQAEFNFESASSGPNIELEDLAKIKAALMQLENSIESIVIPADGSGITKSGSYIFELLASAGITFEKKTSLLEFLEQIIQHLSGRSGIFTNTVGLQKLMDIIQIVFSVEPPEGANVSSFYGNVSKYYKVHIHPDTRQRKKPRGDVWSNSKKQGGKVLSYWCFSPGYTMHDFMRQGVRSIILTSGTLCPISSFTMEMQIPFPVSLENPHVIEKHQIWVGIIPRGPDGSQLSSEYQRRDSEEYLSSMAMTIGNIGRVVPHGLLVFFPSYSALDTSLTFWQEHGQTARLEDVKPVFVEPRAKGTFSEVIEAYYDKIRSANGRGASFLAVCRGKASEGLDFADCNGRGVIITGLPFLPSKDPRVVLKMQFLDEMKRSQGSSGMYLSGQEWYRQQASRAVNQAIGRVIRHKNDYGAIFLCDYRFNKSNICSQLSSWVRPYVRLYDNFGHVIRDVSQFFRVAQKIMPAPQPQNCQKKGPTPITPTDSQSQSFVAHSSTREFLKKAKNLDSHVPSLKRRREDHGSEAAMGSVFDGYDQDISGRTHRPTGLLDALEYNEKKLQGETPVENKVSRLSTLSLQYDKRLADEQKHGKRKIKIVQNRAPESTAESDPKLNSATTFLGSVKQSLSLSNYQVFTDAINTYKQDSDLTTLVGKLSSLFCQDQATYHLMRGFYMFVQPRHKQQFEKTCKDLTGSGCGYKPEHSIPRTVREKASAGKFQASVYLNQVKEALGPSNFQRFSMALSSYKSSDNYELMVCEIVALFTDCQEHYSLLKDFHWFVRPHHKKMFNVMCEGLIGDGHCLNEKEIHPHGDVTGPPNPGTPINFIVNGPGDRDPERKRTDGDQSISQDKPPFPTFLGLPYLPDEDQLLCSECGCESAILYKCPVCKFTRCLTCWKTELKKNKVCPECGTFTKWTKLEGIY